MAVDRLNVEEIRTRYSYNPITGEVRYKNWFSGLARNKVGELAGTVDSNGYYFIKYKGKRKPLTHIIWAIQTGNWPEHEVDHKDRDRSNHKWENLRDATRLLNNRNKGNSKNSIERKGNGYILSYWNSEEKKKYRIGTFSSEKDALNVRSEIDSGSLSIPEARKVYLQSKFAGGSNGY